MITCSLKERKSIEIQCSFFEKILGTKIDFSFIKQKLNAIGCKISENKTAFFVTPPTWRQDINIPEDLVEEVGRLLDIIILIVKKFLQKI